MLISKAYAAAEASSEMMSDIGGAPTPSPMWDIGLVVILVILFYVLLIMPQQRRFKEHSAMLSDLKKGDSIVTGGGLIGKIEKIIDDKEVVLDLGNGVKVSALRSMIQGKTELKPKSAANDSKTEASKPKTTKTTKTKKDTDKA